MAPLEFNVHRLTLIPVVVFITILTVETRPLPEGSYFAVSCGAEGSATFHYLGDNFPCFDIEKNNNCETFGLFAAEKAKCNECCDATETTTERPKTVRKDSTVPTTSKMNVTPSLEALNATNMTDTDITSASDTPVWLIVTATIVALILRGGLAAYCYHHSQSQQPAIRTVKHLVIAQNGADAKNTKKFYVGIPLDGSYGIDM